MICDIKISDLCDLLLAFAKGGYLDSDGAHGQVPSDASDTESERE